MIPLSYFFFFVLRFFVFFFAAIYSPPLIGFFECDSSVFGGGPFNA